LWQGVTLVADARTSFERSNLFLIGSRRIKVTQGTGYFRSLNSISSAGKALRSKLASDQPSVTSRSDERLVR
jgi:hypothetical protein